eukprot:2356038-Alexandrium_andersonii.AAC.1
MRRRRRPDRLGHGEAGVPATLGADPDARVPQPWSTKRPLRLQGRLDAPLAVSQLRADLLDEVAALLLREARVLL